MDIKVDFKKDKKRDEKYIFTYEQQLGLYENIAYWHYNEGEVTDAEWEELQGLEEKVQEYCEHLLKMGYPKAIANFNINWKEKKDGDTSRT